MPTTLTALRIFIASPGDLGPEREILRDEVTNFNDDVAHEAGFVFIPIGWELVAPSVGRPQATINEEVKTCDFMITLFWQRWGSPPSTDPTYSSGTEEELTVAATCLGEQSLPMRDIALFFKGPETSRLTDPGPQLTSVLSLRTRIEQSKELLFCVFDTGEELRRRTRAQLTKWMNEDLSTPAQVEIDLFSPSDVTAPGAGQNPSPSSWLEQAKKHADDGLVIQAEACFAQAIKNEDVEALSDFAHFLRQTGRLEKAFEINQHLISLPDWLDAGSVGATLRRSRVLANMGVIRRKQMGLNDSEAYLQEAVRTATDIPGQLARQTEAYCRDNYGHTLNSQGRQQEALEQFEASLKLREDISDYVEVARSRINLARMKGRLGEHAEAIEIVMRAIEALEEGGDERLALATSYTCLADLQFKLEQFEQSALSASKALEINEQAQNSDGLAISNGQLARLALAAGDLAKAEQFARRALEINQSSSNVAGERISERLLREVLDAKPDNHGIGGQT